jgi:hypothetical protein
MVFSLFAGRMTRANAYILIALAVTTMLFLCVAIYDTSVFDPIYRLIKVSLLDKADSESAKGRAYWNEVSLRALLDTDLLGVGMGSSRTSSWVIAVISQLGFPGTLLFCILIWQLSRSMPKQAAERNPELAAFHNGARASGLCSLLAAAVSGATADPGIQVFIMLAIVLACRRRVNVNAKMRAADQLFDRTSSGQQLRLA